MLVGSESVDEENLWVAIITGVSRTRIWGSEPPDPPLRSDPNRAEVPSACVWVKTAGRRSSNSSA
jgi:hypothetical protein